MNRKIIATILALGMVATAFAMMATPVKAASYHSFVFADINDGTIPRVVDSDGGINPNGGINRFWKITEPQYVNQRFTLLGGEPYVGMSDIIGLNGQAAGDYATLTQTFGGAGPTDVLAGDVVYHALELDANRAAEPKTYYSSVDGPTGYGWTVVGNVPNGYLWAGNAPATADADEEVFPGTAPATTFYKLYQMPLPVEAAGSWSWSFPAHEATTVGNTAACIQTWNLMESANNNGPWASVGSANYGTAIPYAGVANNWYSVRVVWQGGVNSAVLSAPWQMTGGPVNVAPVVDTAATAPAVHDGNTVTEYVTLSATASDADAGPAATTLEYSWDGGAWTPFTSPVVLNFPNGYTEGGKVVAVRAYDGADYSATVWANFTITDTTAPLAAWGTVPGATAFWTNDIVFTATYEDFTAMNFALANSYFWYSINAGPAVNIAWTNASFAWGSYTNTLSATIPAGTGAAGNTITYGGQVRSTSVAPQTTILGAGGPITLADPPVLTDPFPVFGAVVLYNGNAGVYTPIAAGAGVPVTVTYFDFALGANRAMNTVTDASGFYTVDIMNVVVADPFGIEVMAGPFTGYGNMGYNWVAVVPGYAVGGVQVDVTCGIPYNVDIFSPDPGVFSATAGIAFNAVYNFYDVDGVLAQGYYTFVDGTMQWYSNDPLFAPPAGVTFNGVASATPGTFTQSLTLFTAPNAWINITEGGAAELNPYLTPLGAISTQIGGVATPLFLKDWDNITLNILAGGFDWLLVSNGWNIVSAPQDPVMKGVDGTFDAADALAECFAQTADATLVMATREAAGTYTVNDLSTAEAAAFDIDGVHGYWIYSEVLANTVVRHMALNYTAAGSNVVTTAAGWNLLGFTHNYTLWTTIPTASDFCDGTIGPGLGAAAKIVATEWDYAAQWYYSYVRTPTFVMPSRDWAWDFSYSSVPGNGFYLWTEAPIAITFNVNY